jgi:hypothetical protein
MIALDRLQKAFWKQNGGHWFGPEPITIRRRNDRIEYICDETGSPVAMVLLPVSWQ